MSKFSEWYNASEEHKKVHRIRCNKWRKEHEKDKYYIEHLAEYNRKRYAEKIKKVYDRLCVICKSKFQTSKNRQKVCGKAECKKAYQYSMWKKWAKEHVDRRREIARDSARRSKK